jgi:hypothetical protein
MIAPILRVASEGNDVRMLLSQAPIDRVRVLIVIAALIRERFDRWLVDLSLINEPFRP